MDLLTDIAVVDLSPSNQVVGWDVGAERVLGWRSDEVLDRPVGELIGCDPELCAALRGHATAGRSASVTTWALRPDGERRYVTVAVAPGARAEAAASLRLLVMAALPASDSSSRQLAAIVESSDDAIVSKDLNSIVISWNAAAERLFGYRADEMIGRSIRTIIPDDRQEEEDLALATIRSGRTLDHFETVRRRKNGELIEISLTISPIRGAHGEIVGASKIARDITDLKSIDRERLRLLEQSASVMATLNRVGVAVASDLDRTSMVQAVTDAATELTTAGFGAFFYNVTNESGESYMLYTISGVAKQAFDGFPMPRNTEVFAPTFNGREVVRSDDIRADPRYGHNAPHFGMPPGHVPVCSYLAVPVKSRRGEVIGGLFFGHAEPARFTDHHERLAVGIASWASVALENARLYEAVQEGSRLKDDFLASLSHELRTPLNAILGYARIVRSGLIGPEKHAKAMETIERNAHTLAQIIEDVLDVSRIISGKLRLNVRSVDLPDVVRAAIDAVAPTADARGIRVESILDPAAAPISGDPDRLQQVFWNLLTNAVKFTSRGGKVQVRLERVNSHVEISVNDTGIGIHPDFLPHVFERFRQAETGIARERGGLGLGLAIARQLVEGHGGTIDAASAGPGLGATFRVKLPLMIVHPTLAHEVREHPRSAASLGETVLHDLHGVHVLAVDDERDALSLVFEVLEAAGARVTTAFSAAQALTAIEQDVPDVLVSDLGMPQMDGLELIATIRKRDDPAISRIPAAALTAYARSADRVKALRAGFQIHLAKPIDPAELVATVAALARRL